MDKDIKASIEKRERIVWPDVLKCFAIFLVIFGHIVSVYDNRGYSAPVNKWIYSFHMPLFMMLSGLFFKYSLSKKFRSLVKEKSLQLLVPLLTWSIILLCAEQLLLTDFNNWGGIISNYIKSGGPLRGLWYLKCLFIFIIVNYGLVKILKNEYLAGVVSIIIFLLLPNINFTRMMIPFFWLGFFYEKIELKLNHKYTLAISGAIMICCYMFLDISKTYLSNLKELPSYLEFLIIGLSASLFWISLFRLLFKTSRSRSSKTLQEIGGFSLGIYCSHELFYFKDGWSTLYGLLPSDFCSIFMIFALLVLSASFIFTRAIHKFSITRLIFLGSKTK